jgi:hypothetical protein
VESGKWKARQLSFPAELNKASKYVIPSECEESAFSFARESAAVTAVRTDPSNSRNQEFPQLPLEKLRGEPLCGPVYNLVSLGAHSHTA